LGMILRSASPRDRETLYQFRSNPRQQMYYKLLPICLLLVNLLWTSIAQPAHALRLSYCVNPDGTAEKVPNLDLMPSGWAKQKQNERLLGSIMLEPCAEIMKRCLKIKKGWYK
jgi:hypothetical protein